MKTRSINELKNELKSDGPPEAVKTAVNAYLLAQANAETLTEHGESIQRELLATADYYPAAEWVEKYGEDRTPIREPKEVYLMDDDEGNAYFADTRRALEDAGFKIEQSHPEDPYYSYKCPALVAQGIQRTAARCLIICGARWIGVENPEDFPGLLLQQENGLQKRQEFIDLLCRLIVNMPDFRNPLTGAKMEGAKAS